MRKGENIRKRKSGLWEGRYICKYDLNNKAVYKSVYARSYTEVKEKLRNAKENKPIQNQVKNVNLTFNDLSVIWLEMKRIKIKQSTYAKYTNMLENHIYPVLGDIKIKSISRQLIDKYVIEKSDNLSSKTLCDIISLIKQIIRYAEKENLIYNFDYDIVKPKKEENYNNREILTDSEQEILINYLFNNINNDIVKVGVLLSLLTGLRLGEVCALKYNDIDFEKETINIKRTVQRIQNIDKTAINKTILICTTPKSKNSVREIPIPKSLIHILKNSYKENAYILTGKVYKFIEPRLYQYKFKSYLEQCGIEYINYHSLRHTFATNTIRNNTDYKTLSELLGHSSVKFTFDKYIHSSLEQKRLCINGY